MHGFLPDSRPTSTRRRMSWGLAFLAVTLCSSARAVPPAYDHVVVVIEENESYSQVIGNTGAAPYINSLANSNALFTNMRGITHPSHPNYLEFFSGNNQGVTGDGSPAITPLSTPNLGAALRAAGRTFTGYADGLPAAGDIVSDNTASGYVRRHCPWVWWVTSATPTPANRLPTSVHQPFTAFPSNFTQLPTVSFVVPSNSHNMHDGSIFGGDTWLQANLGAYAAWAPTHNSLLVVVWDEDNFQFGTANLIPMIFVGANVRSGVNAGAWTLHNLLRTIEDMYALPHSGSAASLPAITGTFTGERTLISRRFQQGVGGYAGQHDTLLNSASPGTTSGSVALLGVLGGASQKQSLIRFDSLFGALGSQVPAGAILVSAKLTLMTDSTDNSIGTMNLHRMLVPWTEASTWTSLAGGVSTNGTEALTAPDFTAVPSYTLTATAFDVTTSALAWAGGANNYGWTIQSASTDSWSWNSAESGYRPTLDIAYFIPDALTLSAALLTVPPGGMSASFSVTRSGDGSGAVALNFATSDGTAQAGSDYDATSGTLSWVSGETGAKTVQIPITADTTVEGNESFSVALSGLTGPAAFAGGSTVAVTIAEPPIDVWRFQKFGVDANTPGAANAADSDQDGVVNLAEYAYLADPHDGLASANAPLVAPVSDALALTFRRNLSATDLTYTVQVSDDLATWHDGSTYSSTGTTAANAYTTETSRTPFSGYEIISVSDNTLISLGTPHFIRLQLTLSP